MIVLERCQVRRTRKGRHLAKSETYLGDGFRARRNGCLLLTLEHHVRQWVTEERARKALAKDWPGEEVVLTEEAAE